jgi:predicted nuclease of predicted toxin-antitoxin system
VKPLLDENLSPSLRAALADVYPELAHVRDVGLQASPDSMVWRYAAEMGYTIVTKDADFRQRSFLYGAPPKVIWIRLGNCSTRQIGALLRNRRHQIEAFHLREEEAFLLLT